jgi:AcrR family transcriptional regulator
MTSKPLTREQRKAQTRTQLLDAARKVFRQKGFLRATVEEVAAEAGLTTGAIYSAVGGKSELFFAVLDQHMAERANDLSEAVRDAPSPEAAARRVARYWVESLRREPDWTLLLIEFWAYAARDPDLHRELATRHRRVIGSVAALWTAATAEYHETEFLLSPVELARVGWAMGQGFALEWLIDPEGWPDDLSEWFSLFYRGAALINGEPAEEVRT